MPVDFNRCADDSGRPWIAFRFERLLLADGVRYGFPAMTRPPSHGIQWSLSVFSVPLWCYTFTGEGAGDCFAFR